MKHERCAACRLVVRPEIEEAVYPHGTDKVFHEECFSVGFTCGVCDESYMDDDLHHLAVVGAVDGVPRGVYRIVSFPFYADGHIETMLFRHALKRDGHLIGTEPTEWPVCLLCPTCAAERGAGRGKEGGVT